MTLPHPFAIDNRSLSSQIYEHLREAIIEGHIAPGTKLREQALADQYNVSRVPLREAIPQLEAEGFVHTVPRRGTIVTQLTMRDVHDLFDIRESLEVLAARLAATQAGLAGQGGQTGSPLIDQMRDCLRRARVAVRAKSDRDVAATSAEFHALVVELSGNALLRRMMGPISGRVRWLFRLTSARDQRVACRAHEGIFNAIRQGDVELAGKLAFEHIASGRQPSIDILQGTLPE